MIKLPFIGIIFVIVLQSCSNANFPSEKSRDNVCNSIEELTINLAEAKKSHFEGACILYYPSYQDYSEAIDEIISTTYGAPEIKALKKHDSKYVSESWEEYIWSANPTCSITMFNYVQKEGADNTPDSIKVSC